ncbi:MAG TPA: hypothetical protein VF177_09820 [Anaerolineae bacterium]
MFILAAAIAFAQEQFVSVLRASTSQVKKWGGRILVLVGLWLIVLSIWADFFAQFFPV